MGSDAMGGRGTSGVCPWAGHGSLSGPGLSLIPMTTPGSAEEGAQRSYRAAVPLVLQGKRATAVMAKDPSKSPKARSIVRYTIFWTCVPKKEGGDDVTGARRGKGVWCGTESLPKTSVSSASHQPY